MQTTLLIVFPLVAALVVWLAPLPRDWTAGLAFLAAVAEVGWWIGSLFEFDRDTWSFGIGPDFDSPELQHATSREWFDAIGASYSVGFHGYSFWLAGLTVVVGAAAVAYAVWAGRDRPRAYYGLMLFLIGSVVGVFAAQDLLLFYVFFEAMLIPLYILIGVWGGPDRQRATLTFVLYTMAGSLLMLASVVAFGVSQGTFNLQRGRPSREQLDLPRLRRRLRRQGAVAARSTAGCAVRTRRRRPRCRRCSPAWSRRPPWPASSRSCCCTSPSPSTTSGTCCWCSARQRSCTARCSPSARTTSAA